MTPLLFTLYENDYHYGAAALVNSAIRCGFKGRFCIFHRGELPAWSRSLPREGENRFLVGGSTLDFRPFNPPQHLGYRKPSAALEALRLYEECDAVFYADPDVVFLSPWPFFEKWVSNGVAVCLDSNFALLPDDHPWRAQWRELLEAAGYGACPGAPYPNGGFFGLKREERGFLEVWEAITRVYEAQGNDVTRYFMTERHRAIVGCQDLMAAALMGWSGRRSTIGPDGMGFTGYHHILSHDIDSPKAWRRPFVRRALAGYPPSRSGGLYLEYCNEPIRVFSPLALARRKAAYRFAQLISRVWKR